jgi:signal transduction histidine kinase
MGRPRNSRNALAWQAAVILLPVIALAALGAFYLRQDRLLVRHEAEERARVIAHDIAEKLWRGLTNSAAASQEFAFRIDNDGDLLFPPPYEKAPSPRPLETSRPERSAVLARFGVGMALAAENRLEEAAAIFRAFYESHPDAVGETGLPLAPLAALKYIDLIHQGRQQGSPVTPPWDTLCRDVIAKPSALTSLILQRATGAGALPEDRINHYREQWEMHEKLRELYRASRPQLTSTASTPPLFWIHSEGCRWLLSRLDNSGTNHWVICRATPFKLNNDPPPKYAAVGVTVANEPVIAPPSGAVLASAAHAENGRELLKVSLHLTKPELLYARQKQRVIWFGLLIIVSTAAAIIGLISAWRSFQKQERLAELKDNFVSSVSHELRAPIASVRLMAEGLERGRVNDPAKVREYHHFIVQECQRLSALIQNVLDFSRIDQGRKQYEFEVADAVRLVEETVKAMEPSAMERQIRLCFSPATSAINAVIDARAIQQALVNLIDNAVKHSSPGSEVAVGVITRNSATPPVLEIAVEDRGEGIAKSEHERIFERFYRVGSELRRQTPGAGIGLSIVKHIVDAHGGRVRVESEPGKGSRFTIEIPLKG